MVMSERLKVNVDELGRLPAEGIDQHDRERPYRAAGDGAEAFEFARTASRLIEMRSLDYLAAPHGADKGASAGDLGGLIDT